MICDITVFLATCLFVRRGMLENTMSEDKKPESLSKLKVEEVLADFFVKNMTKESHPNLKKHKKHKKKSKKKHKRSSSSSGKSDASDNYHKHQVARHRSRSQSSDHKKKQSQNRGKSVEKYSRDKMLKYSSSSSPSDEDGYSKVEWVEKVVTLQAEETNDRNPSARLDNQLFGLNVYQAENGEDSDKVGRSDVNEGTIDTCYNSEGKGESTVEAKAANGKLVQEERQLKMSDMCSEQAYGNPMPVFVPSTKELEYVEINANESSRSNYDPKVDTENQPVSSDDKNCATQKSRLSTPKQRELLDKFTKHDQVYWDMTLAKYGKKHKTHDNSEKSERISKHHSEKKAEHRSRHGHGETRETDFERKRSRASRSRSRERYGSRKSHSLDEAKHIDKEKLREVARKNALAMMEKGILPEGINADILKKGHVAIKAGGKSVKELTDFCRNLSAREGNVSIKDEVKDVQDDSNQPFIHHPFKVKEPSVIKLNIRNSVQLPIKSHAEKVTENARTLSLQFPVSSGNQHRQKELEWVPVERSEPTVASTTTQLSSCQQVSTPPASNLQKHVYPPFAPSDPPPLPSTPLLPVPTPPPINIPLPSMPPAISSTFSGNPLQSTAPVRTQHTPAYNQAYRQSPTRTFYGSKSIDVHNIVSKRFNAIIKLNQNPNDVNAANDIHEAELQIQAWIESQQVPGQFTGSTNVKLLTAEQLSGPRPVWVKKDVFSRAAPVTEGKGMSLLRKMGWNPGEGLGKNKEGNLEPLSLDIKTDKKGLVSVGESGSWGKLQLSSLPDFNAKHPVSILMEFCSKKKWEPPLYTVVDESGPSHKRSFLFKVLVNNKEYQPSLSRQSKKQAKAEAAILCLQSLAVLPRNYRMA